MLRGSRSDEGNYTNDFTWQVYRGTRKFAQHTIFAQHTTRYSVSRMFVENRFIRIYCEIALALRLFFREHKSLEIGFGRYRQV